uniref:Uncharacterized protein n=1 Tax=viral metagenome TaxID=1070528 RepID=A0A2V0RA17_9ZZZZ
MIAPLVSIAPPRFFGVMGRYEEYRFGNGFFEVTIYRHRYFVTAALKVVGGNTEYFYTLCDGGVRPEYLDNKVWNDPQFAAELAVCKFLSYAAKASQPGEVK